ncbi:MAG: SDR family oxidoreductase [Actinobacteria bacterium]|nr:SDR family oxidoreductase [Actinomycetota bacterium]
MDRPVALVAGASRGLGLLIARKLLDREYAVAICARDRTELDAAVELLAGHGPPAPVTGHACDVASRDEVAELVSRVERELGPIEVLISVAGVIRVGPAESMTLEHFDEAIGTMLRGPVQLAWEVLPGMRQRGRGRIGTIASIGGTLAPPHLLPYATAKFGAVGFSEGLSAELAGSGVTATTVIPGLMRTGSHERATFTGDHGAEYAWFAPSASLPLLSMNAERAAAKIVDGVLGGRRHVVLTPLAKVGMRVHGLAPSSTVAMLGLVGRLLPAAPDPPRTPTLVGHQAQRVLDSRAVRALTVLGSRAARRNNERSGRSG